MLKHFYAFSENSDSEELHQMRVEIKKVYAMMWLERKCSSKKGVSEKLLSLKKIYKHAGKIRTAQINLQLISKYKRIDKKYVTLQRRIVSTDTKTFCAMFNAYRKQLKASKQIILKSFFDIKDIYIQDLYNEQIKKTANLLSEPNKNTQLHEGRKKIKRLIHIFDFLQKTSQNKLKINIHYFQEIEDLIGKWHDFITTLGLLKKTAFKEKQLIMRLENQCKITRIQIASVTENFSKKIIS